MNATLYLVTYVVDGVRHCRTVATKAEAVDLVLERRAVGDFKAGWDVVDPTDDNDTNKGVLA